MDISALNTVSDWANPRVTSGSPIAGTMASTPGMPALGGVHPAGALHHHGRGMMKGVMQTLSDLGLTPSGTNPSGAPDSIAASASAATPALQQFMQDLSSALAASPTPSGATAPVSGTPPGSARSAYASESANLRSLITSLNAAGNSTNATLGTLQGDFQKLIGAAKSASSAPSAAGAAATPTLQAFLGVLAEHLEASQSSQNLIGTRVSTSA